MKEPKNKRMFIVKRLAPTDFKGTRCKITDTRQQKSVIHGWDYGVGYLKNQALSIFSKLGIEIEGYSEPTGKDYICLFTSDFETTLRKVKVDN